MSIRTDSYHSVQNEDGTITTTEVSTYTPPTTKEQALAWGGLAVLFAVPFAPLVATIAHDKWVEKREARKARKAQKTEA